MVSLFSVIPRRTTDDGTMEEKKLSKYIQGELTQWFRWGDNIDEGDSPEILHFGGIWRMMKLRRRNCK